MGTSTPPVDYPEPDALADAFHVYEVERDGDTVRYYGEPLVQKDGLVDRIAPLFREAGYHVSIRYETGEHVLVAEERSPGVDGVPWTNIGLFLATVATTLYAGSQWYDLSIESDPASILQAWPFTVAVLGVLAVHEFGHYLTSRYHDVQASLPYFIPIPNLLGTFGAVIRMKDHLPSRKALFDIGVAGPLAGLVVTVIVTAIGVSLPPVTVGPDAIVREVELGYPPLIHLIATVLDEPLAYSDPSLMVNPVVIGGWVGAFVTFLNLLPVGQLDGAHVTRALVGERFERFQFVVPAGLFALAIGVFLFGDSRAVGIWLVWAVLALVFSRVGGATPIDRSDVGWQRKAVGLLTLVLGALCFTPVPIVFTG